MLLFEIDPRLWYRTSSEKREKRKKWPTAILLQIAFATVLSFLFFTLSKSLLSLPDLSPLFPYLSNCFAESQQKKNTKSESGRENVIMFGFNYRLLSSHSFQLILLISHAWHYWCLQLNERHFFLSIDESLSSRPAAKWQWKRLKNYISIMNSLRANFWIASPQSILYSAPNRWCVLLCYCVIFVFRFFERK